MGPCPILTPNSPSWPFKVQSSLFNPKSPFSQNRNSSHFQSWKPKFYAVRSSFLPIHGGLFGALLANSETDDDSGFLARFMVRNTGALGLLTITSLLGNQRDCSSYTTRYMARAADPLPFFWRYPIMSMVKNVHRYFYLVWFNFIGFQSEKVN
jgi:hypothetical protein